MGSQVLLVLQCGQRLTGTQRSKSPALLGAIGIAESFYVEITFYLNGKVSLCERTLHTRGEGDGTRQSFEARKSYRKRLKILSCIKRRNSCSQIFKFRPTTRRQKKIESFAFCGDKKGGKRRSAEGKLRHEILIRKLNNDPPRRRHRNLPRVSLAGSRWRDCDLVIIIHKALGALPAAHIKRSCWRCSLFASEHRRHEL